MRNTLLLFLLSFIFSACVTTPEVSSDVQKESQSKILANQTDAQQAQNEYKKLQQQRDKE